MKDKKGKIISIIIIVFLLIAIGILIGNILSKEKKEITVAEDFIEELLNKNIINDYKTNKETLQDISLNKLGSKTIKSNIL